MHITNDQAKELMVKVGLFGKDVVGAWKPDRLAEKINKLPRLVDKIPKGLAADLLKLYKKVAAAVEAGDKITLGADRPAGKGKPAAAPAKGKPAKGKAKPAADEEDEDDEEESDDGDDDSDEDDADDSDDDSDDAADDDTDDSDDEEDESDDAADDEDGDDDADDSGDDEEDSDEEDEDSDDGDDEDDADGDDDTDDEDSEDDEDSDDDEEDDDVEAPAKKKAGKKDAKPAKGAVKSAGGDGKPGIIDSIVEFLETATAEKPLTKDKIHDRLVKRFKDRNSESMWTTVNLQVPNKLRTDKGLNVQKNEKGYYIAAGKAKAAAGKVKPKAEVETPVKKKVKK